MLNLAPDDPKVPASIESDDITDLQQQKQFRVMHRYQVKFLVDETGKMVSKTRVGEHIADKGSTKVGIGIEENQLYPGSPQIGPIQLPFSFEPETNHYNRNEPLAADGKRTSGFSTARIGETGRNVNWRLFGMDAPWIFSEIIFEIQSDRSVKTIHKASVDVEWENGSLTQGDNPFNNLNIYLGVQSQDQGGNYKITYKRKGLLRMEDELEDFINSASGDWPEPDIPPSVQ